MFTLCNHGRSRRVAEERCVAVLPRPVPDLYWMKGGEHMNTTSTHSDEYATPSIIIIGSLTDLTGAGNSGLVGSMDFGVVQ